MVLNFVPSVAAKTSITTTSIDRAKRQAYTINLAPTYKSVHDDSDTDDDLDDHQNQIGNYQLQPNDHHGFKRPRLEDIPLSGPALKPGKIVSRKPLEKPELPSEYTQRKLAASTPTATQNPLLSLSHPRYGLPTRLVQNFEKLGISRIYPWQSSCLRASGLLEGKRNLVYEAPTGGGKSLVADVLMLNQVIRQRKKAVLILPYVALVQEKLKWLRRAVENVEKEDREEIGLPLPEWRRKADHKSIRVVGLFGGSKARVSWPDIDIAVCTIEKANAIVNTAIEDGTIRDLSVLVIDELHMIDDSHRGYLLELATTKLKCIQNEVQIIGMSATLADPDVLVKWLGAIYYKTVYEPIPIEEYLVFEGGIYPAATSSLFFKTASQLNNSALPSQADVTPFRTILPSLHPDLKKPTLNAVVSLTYETVQAGYGALVFCGSRMICESTAETIARTMSGKVASDVLDRRKDLLTSLRALPIGLDAVLEQTIPSGVAFHHAGLTVEERELIAEAYDLGYLKVIVATCSLAAGINLPARRVVLYGARMGRDLVGPALLRQMRGRAGRKGKDELGESFICCEKADLEDICTILEADLQPIESGLSQEKRGLARAILEVVAINLGSSSFAIQDYVAQTLHYHGKDESTIAEVVTSTLEDLASKGQIVDRGSNTYKATPQGQAIVAASLTPDDGIFIHDELSRALQAFVLDGDMHAFYTFTPLQTPSASSSSTDNLNWRIFRKEIDSLDASSLRVASFVGVHPGLVNRMANGAPALPDSTPEEIQVVRVHRRFYAALQLRDLCNEMPVHVVARKYEVPRGFVQTLAQTCEGFAAGMIKFCARMGWGMLTSILEHMCDRLKAGARADLLELARIPFVKSRTARAFWEHGFRSFRLVAEADVGELVEVLMVVQPKRRMVVGEGNGDGEWDGDGDREEEKYRAKMWAKAEIVVQAAGRLWGRQQRLEADEQEFELE
ncbi:hypothetical protein MMC25_000024 [Agyrium rufum]|nr:hypothetical protein [Agyrium rufum]